jgi:hypothetical protein
LGGSDARENRPPGGATAHCQLPSESMDRCGAVGGAGGAAGEVGHAEEVGGRSFAGARGAASADEVGPAGPSNGRDHYAKIGLGVGAGQGGSETGVTCVTGMP